MSKMILISDSSVKIENGKIVKVGVKKAINLEVSYH